MRENVEKALEKIRPALQADGGNIELVDVDEETGVVSVKMTLTSPGCPAAGTLPGEVEDKIRRLGVEDIKDVKVEVTWEPPWDPSKMTEAARLQLGMF